MSRNTLPFLAVALALLSCSCATTTVKSTWRDPNHPGHSWQKIAVLVLTDESWLRTGIEYGLVQELEKQGQPAFATLNLMRLPRLDADKAAAEARLRREGADSILIIGPMRKTTSEKQMVAKHQSYGSPALPGAVMPQSLFHFWMSDYKEMGAVYSSSRDQLILESDLYDLNTGQRIWSATTRTVVKEDDDRLVVTDQFAAKVAGALRKDKMIP